MKRLAGTITMALIIGALVAFSHVDVLAWGINFPGGSVQWGTGRGAVSFPGGQVRWGEQGAVQFPGGRVRWNDRGSGDVGIDVPGFRFNNLW